MDRRNFLNMSLALPIALSINRAIAATPRTLKYGSIGGTTDAGIFIGQELGYFQDVGLVIDYQRLESAGALIAALATGQLDVAGISLTPGMFASVQQGIKLRIVGDKESIIPNFMATQFVVRKELAEGSVEDIVHRMK